MTDTTVKIFDSSMTGAPTLANVAGNLLAVLDACLVDGFGLKTVDSLVVAGGLATATIATGHSARVNTVVLIAGATPPELNGEKRVLSTTTNTVVFDATGTTDQTATGTITLKLAPAGWVKAFTGTNKVAYKSGNVAATGLHIRIDDAGTTSARAFGAEGMTDVDTYTAKFPTEAQMAGGAYIPKANSAATKKWWIIANDRFAYLAIAPNAALVDAVFVMGFGDVASKKSPDNFKFAVFLKGAEVSGGTPEASLSPVATNYSPTANQRYLARSYLGTGGSQAISFRYALMSTTTGGILETSGYYSGNLSYPNAADNGLILSTPVIFEGSTYRAELPGAYFTPQMTSTLINQDSVFEDTPVAGKKILYKQLGAGSIYAGGMFFDITGPWAN